MRNNTPLFPIYSNLLPLWSCLILSVSFFSLLIFQILSTEAPIYDTSQCWTSGFLWNRAGIKTSMCSLPIRLAHKPLKSPDWTRVHQIRQQTHKFPSHPYWCSCLFLKIFQCGIIILLCRSEVALCQIWGWSLGTFIHVWVNYSIWSHSESFRLIFSSKALNMGMRHHKKDLHSSAVLEGICKHCHAWQRPPEGSMVDKPENKTTVNQTLMKTLDVKIYARKTAMETDFFRFTGDMALISCVTWYLVWCKTYQHQSQTWSDTSGCKIEINLQKSIHYVLTTT